MISAIILAAGESKRMGQPKMLLKWGETTVLERVIAVFHAGGIQDVLVITGGAREQVEKTIGDSARTIFNEDYKSGEMLSSIQTGLAAMQNETEAVLVGLGDQPQIMEETVRLVVQEYERTGAAIIVPSYLFHRGHPWLVAREHWKTILNMQSPDSPREFLNRFRNNIHYVEVDTPTILQDLDTPEDYSKAHP
jgi:molybdenum cofactor cytidylyltransferase